jgi:hypothetical protein
MSVVVVVTDVVAWVYLHVFLLWEANRFPGSQIPRILWNRKVYYRIHKCARHLSLSWARSIQSVSPNSTFWRFILILFFHLRLGLPSDSFPQVSAPKPRVQLLRATYPAHFILLDLIIRIIFGEEYRSLSSPLCSLLHSSVTLCILGQNILFSTLFSNTLSLRSSLSGSDRVSHSYN